MMTGIIRKNKRTIMAGGLIFFYIHPDDEIAAAGLLCKLIGKNIPVHLVLGTCGHGGGEAKPGKTVGETREEEMKASAKVLGADTLDIWDYIDPEWDGKGNINDLADFVIDVTEYQEFKKMALRCHESQPYSKSDAWKRQYEAYHRQVPKTEGPPDDKMREWLEEEATS